MEGCRRRKQMHEDAEVLMNEDKKEIIFQGNNSSSLYQFLITLQESDIKSDITLDPAGYLGERRLYPPNQALGHSCLLV